MIQSEHFSCDALGLVVRKEFDGRLDVALAADGLDVSKIAHDPTEQIRRVVVGKIFGLKRAKGERSIDSRLRIGTECCPLPTRDTQRQVFPPFFFFFFFFFFL